MLAVFGLVLGESQGGGLCRYTEWVQKEALSLWLLYSLVPQILALWGTSRPVEAQIRAFKNDSGRGPSCMTLRMVVSLASAGTLTVWHMFRFADSAYEGVTSCRKRSELLLGHMAVLALRYT